MTKESSPGDSSSANIAQTSIAYNPEKETCNNACKKRARELFDSKTLPPFTTEASSTESKDEAKTRSSCEQNSGIDCSVVICNDINIIHNPEILPQHNDVLFGHSDWPGTVFFEHLLEQYRPAYMQQGVTLSCQNQLVTEIMEVIGVRKPPGRFFLKTKEGDWIQLNNNGDTIKKMVFEALHIAGKEDVPKKARLSKSFLYNLYTTTEYSTSLPYLPTSVIAHQIRHQVCEPKLAQPSHLQPSPAPPQAALARISRPSASARSYRPLPLQQSGTNSSFSRDKTNNNHSIAAAINASPSAKPEESILPRTSTAGTTDTGSASPNSTVSSQKRIKDKKHDWKQVYKRNAGWYKRHNKQGKDSAELPDNIPKGVTQRPSGKWQAQIYFAGQSRYLGVYKECVAASLAFESASHYLREMKGKKAVPKDEAAAIFATARQEATRAIVEKYGNVMFAD